jgi:hypothetical protein
MLPNTFDLRWTAVTAVAAGVGGLMLLTSLPLAQYFVLRDDVRRPVLWIPINIGAWLLGIAWTLAPSPMVDEATPIAALILIYGIAGFCMAATVAVVTGVGMIRLLRTPIGLGDQGQADKASQSVVRPMRTSLSQPPKVRVYQFMLGWLQLELPAEHMPHRSSPGTKVLMIDDQ